MNVYIPWSLCILSFILAVGLTWYYRTKDMNFLPTDGVAGDISLNRHGVEMQNVPEVGPPPPISLDNELSQNADVMLGLDSYSHLRNDSEKLARLFAVSRANNNYESAYFAGERIMESEKFSDEEKRESALKMSELLPNVPQWVIDENKIFPLLLEISNFTGDSEAKQALSERLITAFDNGSGGMVLLDVAFSEEAPAISIKYGESFSVDNTLPDSPTEETIFSSLYTLLSTLVTDTSPELSLAQWTEVNEGEFQSGMTRLAWSDLLSSFVTETETEEDEAETVEEE